MNNKINSPDIFTFRQRDNEVKKVKCFFEKRGEKTPPKSKFEPSYKLRKRKGKWDSNSTKTKGSFNDDAGSVKNILNTTLPHRISSFAEDEKKSRQSPQDKDRNKNQAILRENSQFSFGMPFPTETSKAKAEKSHIDAQGLYNHLRDIKITFEPCCPQEQGSAHTQIEEPSKYKRQSKFCMPNMIFFKDNNTSANLSARVAEQLTCRVKERSLKRNKSQASSRCYIIT